MNELQIKHLVQGMRRLLLQWHISARSENVEESLLAQNKLGKYSADFLRFVSAYSSGAYGIVVDNYEKFLSITASETGTTKNLSPFDAGKQAFFDGKLLADNPYSGKDALMCGESADQWVSGWLAEKESYANCKIVRHENGKIAVSMEGLNERQS